jgi:23S rRNA (uracil1939-C5)-methyltransferase
MREWAFGGSIHSFGPLPSSCRRSARTGSSDRCLKNRRKIPHAIAFARSSTKPTSCLRLLTNSGAVKTAAVLTRDPILLEDLLENGQGVGRVDGLVTFVTGGLPGERVRVAVDEIKRNYTSAHVVSIEQQSPDRVESPCPVFPRCGGCQTLHLRYEAERVWKRRLVADALARLGGLKDVVVDEVVSVQDGDARGYRNKVSLVCKWKDGRARLGFYEARSHRLVSIEGCPVLIPRLGAAVRQLVEFARDVPQAMRGVEHIVVRASATGSEFVISFNGRDPNKSLGAATPEMLRRIPELTGIVSNWDRPTENAVFGRRFASLWGSPVIRERIAGVTLRFGVASFFQINTPVLETLAARILTMFEGARRVVDLYCGVGTFGVLLGKKGIASTGVESFKPAVDEARANAAENGVVNAAFECATAAEALQGERGRTLVAGADAVILDPPRKGCEEGVLEAIASSALARVAYVSCNPATLARDAKVLGAAGFRIGPVTPFDMFPHTGHVEVLAEFTRTS